MSGMEIFGWAVGFGLGLLLALYVTEWAMGEVERWCRLRRRRRLERKWRRWH